MKMIDVRFIGLVCSLLLLTACGGQKTPQEVTQAFWTAVILNDVDKIVEYSTLGDVESYDRFFRDDWADVKLSWGKVIIDEADASIVTRLSEPGISGEDKLTFATHLVRQGEQWQVDYARTADELRASTLLGGLVNRVGAFGGEISDKIDHASRELDANLKNMVEQFRTLSKSIQESTSGHIEHYSEELQRHMGELADSIEHALKEYKDNASEDDERILREVANDLHESSESLSRTNTESVAESSYTLVAAHQRLDMVEGDTFEQYKKRWKEWRVRLTSEMEEFLDEFFAGA